VGIAFGASIFGGAGAGLGSLNTSGRNDPTTVYNDKIEQYVRFTENLNMANTVSEVFGAAAANMPVTGSGANRVARDQMHKYAAMSRLYNQLGGSVANLNKLSINYGALGLTNGAISADIGLVGGRIQVDEYRNTLGLTRAEGMQEEINAALGRGSRGGVDSNLIIRGKLSGFTSQQIGFAESYRTAGTGLGGLGLSAKGTLQEANALNLTGQAATDYIGAKYGYLGSLAQRGISVGADFVGGTNQFINTGRNLGLRGFEGKLAFERAQEISGLGNRGAGKIGGMFGGKKELWEKVVNQFDDYLFEVLPFEGRLYHEEHIMSLMYQNHKEWFITQEFDTWWHPESAPKDVHPEYFEKNKSFCKILEDLNE